MKWRMMAAALVVMAGQMLPVLGAGSVTVVTNFPANKGPGAWKSVPDAAGAVGPSHAVDFDEAGFVVHDKATGKVLQKLTQHEFWLKVEPANTFDPKKVANDPKLLYDPLSGRWFACCAGTGKDMGFTYLAVSTTSDPTQPWKGVILPAPKEDPGVKLGVDKNGFYVCVYGSNNTIVCLAIPKQDVIAAGGPDLAHLQTFPGLQYYEIPAIDLDPNKAPDAPEVLLCNEFASTTSKLYMYKITWAGLKASISEKQTISLSKPYQSEDKTNHRMDALEPAPGDKIAGRSGRRIEYVFAHGGSVFTCNGAMRASDTRPGILWYEVQISDGALLQEGFVDDPACDYIIPTLAVDGSGNIGVSCVRTSATEFPSIYVMMHAAGDPPNTMRAPVLALPGTTYFRYAGVSPLRMGNYTAICIDPADPNLFWACQQYAGSAVDKEWCTAWVAFTLSSTASKSAEVDAAWPFDATEAAKRQDDTAKALGVPRERTLDLGGGVALKFILIPAGKFMMGEAPGREVTVVKPFYLSPFKVTQAQYAKVMGKNPSKHEGASNPVDTVIWADASAFCTKVSESAKKTVRLTSEAEWEWACRAGTATRCYWGDDMTNMGDYCWWHDNCDMITHPVGQKKPNAFGLYDMMGLLWEWCSDAEPEAGKHPCRGATFGSREGMFKSSIRGLAADNGVNDRYGFRVAMDIE